MRTQCAHDRDTRPAPRARQDVIDDSDLRFLVIMWPMPTAQDEGYIIIKRDLSILAMTRGTVADSATVDIDRDIDA